MGQAAQAHPVLSPNSNRDLPITLSLLDNGATFGSLLRNFTQLTLNNNYGRQGAPY